MIRSNFPQFTELQRWAKERGFFLGRLCNLTSGSRGWPLQWEGPDRETHRSEVTALSQVEDVVLQAIAEGRACQPGKWFLAWEIFDLAQGLGTWCPWRRWVGLLITEGRAPHDRSPRSMNRDSTAYDSPEAALAAGALLGLECGGRLHLTAEVRPLSREKRLLPTSENTPGTIAELILLYIVHNSKETGTIIYSPIAIATSLLAVCRLGMPETEAALERLLVDGYLIKGVEPKKEPACDNKNSCPDEVRTSSLDRRKAAPLPTLRISETALNLSPLIIVIGDKSAERSRK